MMRIFGVAFAVLWLAVPVFAQSQAANGSIEGTVSDPSGGVLPGVTMTITNTDNGTERVIVTSADGTYRAVLLPLGRYQVVGRAARIQALRAGRHHALGR